MIVCLIYAPIFVIQLMNLLTLPDHLLSYKFTDFFSNSLRGVHTNSHTNFVYMLRILLCMWYRSFLYRHATTFDYWSRSSENNKSVYYTIHTICFGLFDHHEVCMNKNSKYIMFMLNYMRKIDPFFKVMY
jgi:hypothetical protein